MLMVPCLFYWLWDPPCQCSPMVTADNAMWVRIVMPIKRCFDIGEMRHKTQTADTIQWPKICFDRSQYREWLIIGEFYLHWSIHWYLVCDRMDCALIQQWQWYRGPIEARCFYLRQSELRSEQTITNKINHGHPVRPGVTYTPVSQMSPITSRHTQCLDAIVLAEIKLAAFIFCHVLISTLGWKW